MSVVREGRIWKFGDEINTDLIFPNVAFRMPLAEQHRLVFSANRPGWVDQARAGDLIVGGHNFGMGSGRPVGRLLGECGIAGVVAESVNGLCLRNCLTYGLAVLSAPGIAKLMAEGERMRVDFASGVIQNLDRGTTLQAVGLPKLFQDLVTAGGSVPMLIKEGWIEPEPRIARSS
jgi:3-isopropylmalate/(R)-2-methylmalate dehydratase small subunit